jgi:hypothetical protein
MSGAGADDLSDNGLKGGGIEGSDSFVRRLSDCMGAKGCRAVVPLCVVNTSRSPFTEFVWPLPASNDTFSPVLSLLTGFAVSCPLIVPPSMIDGPGSPLNDVVGRSWGRWEFRSL